MFEIKSVSSINKQGQVYQQVIFESKQKRELKKEEQIMIALYFDIYYIFQGLKENSLIWQNLHTIIQSDRFFQAKIFNLLKYQAQNRDQSILNAIKNIFDTINQDFSQLNLNLLEKLSTQMLTSQGYQFSLSQDKSQNMLEIIDPKQNNFIAIDQQQQSSNQNKLQQMQEKCSRCEYSQEVFLQFRGNEKYCFLCFEQALNDYI
ncbi:hypothetical protein ABPG72_005401 [Tetrahymena utriculariae]